MAMTFQVTEAQEALMGADYPMEGGDLADLARRNGAGGDLVEALQEVPQVERPNAVMSHLKDRLGGATDS